MNTESSSRGPVDPFERPVIWLRVHDVEAARAFYHRVFNVDATDADPGAFYPEGSHAILFRILGPDEIARPAVGDMDDGDAATPRCELVVDDVEAWLDRVVDAGGIVAARVIDERGHATYAQWRDPFGHLWTLAVDKTTLEADPAKRGRS